MRSIKFYQVAVIVMSILWMGCGDDTPTEMMIEELGGKYASGVFVVNQGSFGNGTGTISFFDRDTTILQEIYQDENGGSVLGNIAQSMYSSDGTTYIAVNNAAKIEVVNSEDFISIATIEGLPQVRYITSSSDGSTIFASSWGADGSSGVLYEIDPASNLIINETALGGGLEQMLVEGNDLYIAKSGGFGTDSIVFRYDASNMMLMNEFEVGDNPVGLVSSGSDIYLLCTGAFDFTNPDNNTAGGIYQLQATGFELMLEVANGANNLTAVLGGNTLYYIDGEGIQQVNLTNFAKSIFSAGSYFALGFDNKEGYLYASDAKDFSSNGDVTVFDQNGGEVFNFDAGIIPGNFYFTD